MLLKNRGNVLPLGPDVRRIVVIGGHADKGVLSGGGSSQVYGRGGNPVPGLKPTSWPGPVVYYASPPLRAIRALAPQANVTFVDGGDPVACDTGPGNAMIDDFMRARTGAPYDNHGNVAATGAPDQPFIDRVLTDKEVAARSAAGR